MKILSAASASLGVVVGGCGGGVWWLLFCCPLCCSASPPRTNEPNIRAPSTGLLALAPVAVTSGLVVIITIITTRPAPISPRTVGGQQLCEIAHRLRIHSYTYSSLAPAPHRRADISAERTANEPRRLRVSVHICPFCQLANDCAVCR